MMIMLNDIETRILACFFPALEKKTAKEIEGCSGYSHEPVFRTLKSLVKRKYLKETKIGKTNVYEFIKTDETLLVFVNYMMEKASRFKNKHALLYKRLKEFADSIRADCIILFGSYAKGTETEKSDIDLLCVTNERDVERKAAVFKTKYNITIRPVVVRPDDFKNIKKDNEAFYNDMVMYGIMLTGHEFFFKEVYK